MPWVSTRLAAPILRLNFKILREGLDVTNETRTVTTTRLSGNVALFVYVAIDAGCGIKSSSQPNSFGAIMLLCPPALKAAAAAHTSKLSLRRSRASLTNKLASAGALPRHPRSAAEPVGQGSR